MNDRCLLLIFYRHKMIALNKITWAGSKFLSFQFVLGYILYGYAWEHAFADSSAAKDQFIFSIETPIWQLPPLHDSIDLPSTFQSIFRIYRYFSSVESIPITAITAAVICSKIN